MEGVKAKAQQTLGFVKDKKYEIAVVVGLILFVLITQFIKRRAALKRVQVNDEKCQGSNAAENTVFVVLHGSPESETEALSEIFNKASCPARIRVAAQNEKAIGAYDAKARRLKFFRGTRSYIENVRLSRSSTMFARVRESYRGEKYVFTLQTSSSMKLVDGWDEAGIRMLNDAPPNTVLSVCPGRDNVPGFPCADAHANSSALVVSAASCTDSPPRAIPALFFYAPCSVAFGSAWAAVPSASSVSAAWEPAYLSASFFCAGYTFMIPPSTLHQGNPDAAAALPTHEPMPFQRQLFKSMPKQLSEFEQASGIVFPDGERGSIQYSARAVMGLSNNARPEEILVKFGSWAEYDRVLNSLVKPPPT